MTPGSMRPRSVETSTLSLFDPCPQMWTRVARMENSIRSRSPDRFSNSLCESLWVKQSIGRSTKPIRATLSPRQFVPRPEPGIPRDSGFATYYRHECFISMRGYLQVGPRWQLYRLFPEFE